MSRRVVYEPTITLGTAYKVIVQEPLVARSSVKSPVLSLSGTQTVTPPAVR